MRPHASIFILLFVVFLTGNGLAAETTRQIEQRQAVQKQLELRFGEVTSKLAAVQNTSSTTMKDETRRELVRLREESATKQEAVNKKLSQLGSVAGQEFDRMKAEVNAAIEDLNNLYGRISSLSRT